MTSVEELTVQRLQTLLAPDDRVACFEVSVERTDRHHNQRPPIALTGTVQTDRIRGAILEELQRLYGDLDVRDNLSVLEGAGNALTTDRHVLPIRGEPRADAEQVTQVLYGAALTAYDTQEGWRRVRTPSGYLGWTDGEALTEPVCNGTAAGDASAATPAEWAPDAVVVAAQAPITRSEMAHETVPAGVDCCVEARDGDAVRISFRNGTRATVPVATVRETSTPTSKDEVVTVARQFLQTPYEWGGMTADGIDCSGLVWIAYTALGVTLPRDADQQRALGTPVSRKELEAGDLLFFPGHVAISLGGSEYIHASGSADAVTVNSLDPDDERYVEGLDADLSAMKRLL